MDFYWNVFSASGSIEAYMCHKEYERLLHRREESVTNEYGEHTWAYNKGNNER